MPDGYQFTGVIVRRAEIALRLDFNTFGDAMDWLTSTKTRDASVELYDSAEGISRLVAFNEFNPDGELTRYQR
jgi:hypothetical protein